MKYAPCNEAFAKAGFLNHRRLACVERAHIMVGKQVGKKLIEFRIPGDYDVHWRGLRLLDVARGQRRDEASFRLRSCQEHKTSRGAVRASWAKLREIVDLS